MDLFWQLRGYLALTKIALEGTADGALSLGEREVAENMWKDGREHYEAAEAIRTMRNGNKGA